MSTFIASTGALIRSLKLHYGDASHRRAMLALYGQFLGEGDLAFDVGAHLGNRVTVFRALGAKVVAVEPQVLMAAALRLFFGWRGVPVVQKAVAGAPGDLLLHINSRNPTISSASPDFLRAASEADGWRDQVWDRTTKVEATTLDHLIEQYGRPRFIKIDVEGYELEALSGLSRRVEALSFEFVTIQRETAHACLDRCLALGFTQFNISIGETQTLQGWRSGAEMHDALRRLPIDDNSGDVYAR